MNGNHRELRPEVPRQLHAAVVDDTEGSAALAEPLAEILARRGIERLCAHQAEVIEEDPFAKKEQVGCGAGLTVSDDDATITIVL